MCALLPFFSFGNFHKITEKKSSLCRALNLRWDRTHFVVDLTPRINSARVSAPVKGQNDKHIAPTDFYISAQAPIMPKL